jgi:ABC-type oligopeptide transport system substrate-binding subunit
LLVRLGEVDVAVVYGRTASAFLEDDEPSDVARFAFERLEAWDRVYFLRLGSSVRWTRDPAFRQWLSGTVDRTSMMRYLFDGLGAWPCDLLSRCGEDRDARDDPGSRWRVPSGVRPRIAVTFERRDRIASDIAARIKADLEDAGVGVDLDPRSRDELERGLRSDRFQVVLSHQRSWTADPVLTLLEILHSTGSMRDETRLALVEAAREPPGSARRLTAASAVQDRILGNATIVPLARIDAWVVTAPGLVLDPGVSPSLDIPRAGWLP